MSHHVLQVGDRGARPYEIGGTRLRRGTITERYAAAPSSQVDQTPITLYAVRWDDTQSIERGYLHLEREPLTLLTAS